MVKASDAQAHSYVRRAYEIDRYIARGLEQTLQLPPGNVRDRQLAVWRNARDRLQASHLSTIELPTFASANQAGVPRDRFRLLADSSKGSLPGTIVQGMEQSGKPTQWYHGTADPELTAFSPDVVGGARNSGGRGAVFLTPSEFEARSNYGPHAIGVESQHNRPFVWDLQDIPGSLERGRSIMPQLRAQGDSWLDQKSFFDALKRAGYDALETRSGAHPVELAALKPERLKIVKGVTGLPLPSQNDDLASMLAQYSYP